MIFQPPRIHLFQGYGIELEYMIVDKDTLQVKPVADELLKHELGFYDSDVVNGMITWSNELVMHVIELKSTKPETDLQGLESAFAENVKTVNAILSRWNAMLLPTGAHPFMDPLAETKLWPHGSNEVYETYNRIFDCRGHGWSNLQSTHLNLPFYDDEEFAKLHAAVRMVLPILPALCGSTPILSGKFTGSFDTRLKYYKTNQSKIPSITGRVIPEAVFSRRNYLQTIYEKIQTDLAPHDPEKVLNPIWVNSRGAIARFDRGSIEIRVMDCQESPLADVAIQSLIIRMIKALIAGDFRDHEHQMKWKTESLAHILELTIEKGMDAIIDTAEYLEFYGLKKAKCSATDLWSHILEKVFWRRETYPSWDFTLKTILQTGNLSQRMIKTLNGDYSRANVTALYKRLAECLEQNRIFLPDEP
jgi:gamma-glutamyl:cysteine ligase YbdK (ATP-grasp superfamily)